MPKKARNAECTTCIWAPVLIFECSRVLDSTPIYYWWFWIPLSPDQYFWISLPSTDQWCWISLPSTCWHLISLQAESMLMLQLKKNQPIPVINKSTMFTLVLGKKVLCKQCDPNQMQQNAVSLPTVCFSTSNFRHKNGSRINLLKFKASTIRFCLFLLRFHGFT